MFKDTKENKDLPKYTNDVMRVLGERYTGSKEEVEKKIDTFKRNVLHFSDLCDIIYTIFVERARTTCSFEREEGYETPSWSHKAAHRNGKCEAYEEILYLIDTLQGKRQ